eukprot:CCRYP_002348-RA/>CCRYP_002348-RA protein AED:0.36 eAED:0.36 QI:0/-1/0/1/-1/0/1/0/67
MGVALSIHGEVRGREFDTSASRTRVFGRSAWRLVGTVDVDQELKVHAVGIGLVSMDFVGDVDILGIH